MHYMLISTYSTIRSTTALEAECSTALVALTPYSPVAMPPGE